MLDRSNSYLQIFNKSVVVDKTLPKWQVSKKLIRKNDLPDVSDMDDDEDPDDYRNMNLYDFLNLDSKDFNIYLGKKIADDMRTKSHFSVLDDGISVSNSYGKSDSFITKTYRYFRNFINSNNDIEKEEVFELNIFDFFDKVKLTAKDNESQYALRIEPYMIALKQARDMGQQALVDKLTAEIFNNKYESILYAEGFHFKITEAQIVDFVKKTEKGVQLSYISNFTRPVPAEVIELKKKADSLLVFDNYCVLYYDPEQKAYKQTEEELEAERKKKADPILFGMISGSRNLYYIADWVDAYCDLTLDEFIKVSGIEKQKLMIDEKIKL